MSTRITPHQRDVLDHLSKKAAFSQDKARSLPSFDEVPAEKLAQRGVLNKRYNNTYGAAYWIRGEAEAATGTSVPAGFVVILHRDSAGFALWVPPEAISRCNRTGSRCSYPGSASNSEAASSGAIHG